jgi:hypothetical protein
MTYSFDPNKYSSHNFGIDLPNFSPITNIKEFRDAIDFLKTQDFTESENFPRITIELFKSNNICNLIIVEYKLFSSESNYNEGIKKWIFDEVSRFATTPHTNETPKEELDAIGIALKIRLDIISFELKIQELNQLISAKHDDEGYSS